MSVQKSQAQPQRIAQAQPAKVQGQLASPTPSVTAAPKPDKKVSVPKFAVCMAGDATPVKNVIHGVIPEKNGE